MGRSEVYDWGSVCLELKTPFFCSSFRFNPTENVTPDDVVVCELLKGLVIDDPAYTFE